MVCYNKLFKNSMLYHRMHLLANKEISNGIFMFFKINSLDIAVLWLQHKLVLSSKIRPVNVRIFIYTKRNFDYILFY